MFWDRSASNSRAESMKTARFMRSYAMHKNSVNKFQIGFPVARLDRKHLPLRQIYLVCDHDVYPAVNSDYLAGLGCVVHKIRRLGDVMSELCRNTREASAIIVDIDSLGGLHYFYEELLTLRRAFPDVAVLILSRHFKSDDYSLERLSLCDASLIMDKSEIRMHLGLVQALLNNEEWRRQQKAPQSPEITHS
jgi:hypothetical protein